MGTQTELVSIIIPAFKADRYLQETLEHVGRQTYTHWELIVVEDASQDKTESIVRGFAAQHPDRRVEYVRHETNQGPSGTRNTGISHSQGDYLAFLDADDRWLPDHLSVSVAALQEGNLDFVYSTVLLFDSDAGHLLGVWGPFAEERKSFPQGLYHRCFITTSSVVLRRQVIDTVGLFDITPDLQGCEDIDYWLRCVKQKVRFECLPGIHCLYRKGHGQALTSRMDVIAARHGRVLEKHLGMPEIPLSFQRQQISHTYRRAGRKNMQADPFYAARLFAKSWSYSMLRFDSSALAVLAFLRGSFRKLTGPFSSTQNKKSEAVPARE